ncbi:5-formyltetrahydrofolate cyclo-ligase [Wenzhouxiangella sp. XN24]|nr:5-formyltetrahydrofolate cyclo-ligase [Wenzhouxiangella sp. XN24]
MRARRRALPPFRRRLANQAIVRRITTLPAFRRARSIALYWPADGEPDVRAVAATAWRHDKRVLLPVVSQQGVMRFAAWDPKTRFRRNRYGIPEPVARRLRAPATRLDLVVMPLVAFDKHGNRLGMGGGYYDRALATRGRRTTLVGAAFSCQQAPLIPAQPWDVPLDIVVTEAGPAITCKVMRASAVPSQGAQQ